MALLTFAFPEPLRAELTFSTYHDRPEELRGVPAPGDDPPARPNRHALLAQGYVADLSSRSIEPRIEPAAWSTTLADWLVRGDERDRADWEATRRAARRARPPDVDGSIWAEEWLARMFGLPEMLRQARTTPEDARGWAELAEWAAWAGGSGLAESWSAARPPAWWKAAAASAVGPEACAALRQHLGLAESWRGDGNAAAWGEVVGAPGPFVPRGRPCGDDDRHPHGRPRCRPARPSRVP